MQPMIVIVAVLFLTALPIAARAENILLKNGSLINAKIIEKDARKIKADVNGVVLTYYLDDLRSIDGIDAAEFMAPQAAGVSVQPNTQPTAAPGVPAQPALETSGMSKKELILKFIDVFGTRASLTKNFEDILKNAPPKQVEIIKDSLNVNELIEELVPLYDKHFTEQELQAYINFYSTPAGQKLLTAIPEVMTESVGASLKYFKTKIPSISSQAIE